MLQKVMTQFTVCMVVLLMLATPVFYWLTKSFYAEDMIDVLQAVERGRTVPSIDLEEDVMEGVMMQFGLVTTVLGVAVLLTVRFISRREWRPFYDTLKVIEAFRIDGTDDTTLPRGNSKELTMLNDALNRLMTGSRRSFRAQKEFTENASHELQTPLAVMQTKLDLLMQQPGVTASQADIIHDLCLMTGRMARLNRNLLLLAKMENGQFDATGEVDAVDVVKELLPYLENLLGGLSLVKDFKVDALPVRANRSLFESMVGNLVVNAVRHNREGGRITVTVRADGLSVANTSDAGPLDADHIFNRFYRPAANGMGNGLGLAIVKAVCDYHGWRVAYCYHDGLHEFNVMFT